MAMAIASSSSERAPLSGMTLAAIAFALMTAMDAIFKLIASGHPPYQILFINAGFALVPIFAWAYVTGGFERFHTARPGMHLLRGGLSCVSSICAIYAYSRMSLSDFYAIVFAAPLVVTALSAFWLNEKVDRARWVAVAVGFIGVLIVAHPSSSGATLKAVFAGRLAALLSVFCYALSVVMVRRMRLGESDIAFSLYGYFSRILFCGLILLVIKAPPMHAQDFMHLSVSGVLAGVSSLCLMTAYHRSPLSVVAPFQYTQILWGALAGWLLWAQMPSMHLMAGAVIVAASGLFVIYQEMRLRNVE